MDPHTNDTSDQGISLVQPAQSPAPPVTGPPVPQPVVSDGAAAMPVPDQTGPAQAADNDVIEIEWIQKAKQIISQTRDDPYKQVRQLNQLKADYMQKRYNKTVSLPDA